MVLAFLRMGDESDPPVAVVYNFTPEVRRNYRIGLSHSGRWRETLNIDTSLYGGTNVGNMAVDAEARPLHGLPASATLTFPLATLFLVYEAT